MDSPTDRVILKHPIIRDKQVSNLTTQRDALERLAGIVSLLKEIDFTKGISDDAQYGIYWILVMVEESMEYLAIEGK
ncbi:MAG: hypothetical protein MJA28_02025 [Gammaproteobacteria bacterium]|nr:hypothetical protein [Gammaproteobacteria bacterium]